MSDENKSPGRDPRRRKKRGNYEGFSPSEFSSSEYNSNFFFYDPSKEGQIEEEVEEFFNYEEQVFLDNFIVQDTGSFATETKHNNSCSKKNFKPEESKDFKKVKTDLIKKGSATFMVQNWDYTGSGVQKDKNPQNLKAQMYKNDMFAFIGKYSCLLNLKLKLHIDEEFREVCILMYDDILNSIPYTNEEQRFNAFYMSFGTHNVKNANYIAASLIHFNFARLGENVTRKELTAMLNLSLSSLNRVCSTVSGHLKNIPKYDFILELINTDRLTEGEYLGLFNKYVDNYIEYLNCRNLNDLSFSEGDSQKISDLLWEVIDSMEGEDKFQFFFNSLKKKKAKILAAVMCFIFLKYENDFNLKKGYFIDLLLKNENFDMPRTNFTEVLHQIMLEYFVLDHDKYQHKVENYLTRYFNKLESYFSTDLKVDTNDLIEDGMAIFDYAVVNGFSILDINRNNEIDYYFPQYFAFSLIYYTFKTITGLENLVTPEKLEKCFGSEFNFKHINDRSGNRLYEYIEDYIGRYKGQIYTRETFVEMMRKSLQKFYHHETNFLLVLYQSLDMEPKEFGDSLYIHNTPGTSGVLRVIRNKTSFSDPDTFDKIRVFIRTHHVGDYKDYLIDRLDKIQDLKGTDFKHQGVTYPFRWVKEHLRVIDDEHLREGFYNYLNDIAKEEYPRAIFMDKDNPRASIFKLRGNSKEPISLAVIKSFFQQVVRGSDSSFFLSRQAQEVFNEYNRNSIGKRPDHNPILTSIILNDKRAIAIELPVWKPVNGTDLFFIGHVDLIFYINGLIIVCDYKQDEEQIYRSLPQLTIYGFLLKHKLEDYGVKINNNIICLGFSKDLAYAFNLEEMYPKLLEFVKCMNSQRDSPILCRKIPKTSTRFDIYNILKRLK